MKKLHFTIFTMLFSLLFANVTAQTNYFVKPVSSGTGTGVSWENAATLATALSTAVSGDVIHLAAGKYTPSVLLTGGADDLDMTFEISKNLLLIGGYPASPAVNDTPSDENSTILDGEFAEGYNAYHTVAVTAPAEDGKKVELRNIKIKGGKSATSGAAIVINSLNFGRVNGSAIIAGGSTLKLSNCKIYDNLGYNTPGLYAFSNAKITVDNCLFENNIGTGNGASMWIDGSTIDVYNSNFIANKNSGVGAIQIITNTKANFYNCTIAYNVAGFNNTTNSRNGSGIYVRNGAQVQVVNCTIYGNESNGNGAGIALHSTTAFTGTKATVINSTISENKSLMLDNSTAGIFALTNNCAIDIYNSIISGNTALGTNNYDVAITSGSTLSTKNAVVAEKVFDATGTMVADKTFDFVTMLDTLLNNGGPGKTVQLLLTADANPAKTYGSSRTDLISLGASLSPVIAESIIAFDQLGNSRTGNIMGAWTANKPISGLSSNQSLKPVVYVSGDNLCMQTEPGQNISVYSITGQRVATTYATENITTIKGLSKGNVYIVNVSGRINKVIF